MPRLAEFGVVEARRFTRKGREGLPERTPTVLLTFDRPSCPDRIELDYVVYKVRRHIPNPLMCHQCGKFGHAQVRCENEAKCLICGESKHSGDCQRKCINCGEMDHDCLSRNCKVWKKEREICEIEATREVSTHMPMLVECTRRSTRHLSSAPLPQLFRQHQRILVRHRKIL